MGAAGQGDYFYDSNAGYYNKEGEDLRVDVTDLNSFSTNVRLEMNNFITNWNQAVAPIMGSASAKAFPIGGGFAEAEWARALHQGVMDAGGQLFADAALSFQAISTAAMTIAAEYNNGDIEGAEGLDAISDAFYPTDPKANSLDKMREQAEQEGENGDQGEEGDQPPTTAADTPPETKDPTNQPSDPTNGSNTVGDGVGEVTIGSDPWSETPDLEVELGQDDDTTTLAPGPMDGSGSSNSGGTVA